MITFFLHDYRFGGPHKQINEYINAIPKRFAKGVEIIKPIKSKKNKGLINLKPISKFLFIFENFLNIFYIVKKKNTFFNKNKISCVVGINNIAPLISSVFLKKKTFWFLVENTNKINLCIFHIINFIFKLRIIYIDKFLIKKTNVIPVGILSPLIKKNKLIKKIIKLSKNINVLCVGNINRLKAYDFLIKELIDNSIKCNLDIIGQKLNTQKKLNKKLIDLKNKFECSLNGKVNFLGFKNENFIKKKLIKSDLFILPSYSEGCPIALLEAMSLGCIVIASNVGAIENIIQHKKNGFLFSHRKKNFNKIYNEVLNTELKDLKKISLNAKKYIEINFGNKKKFNETYKKIFFESNLK
jgi:glycosyltransferase involved in cell wall biosynthesis